VQHAHLRAGEQKVVLDLAGAPHGLVVREVSAQRVVDGPPLLRCEHDDLAVLLAGARDLDLTKAPWRRQPEVVRHVLRQHEHPASAAEHLARSALRCPLDREADTQVDAPVGDCGEDPAVLLDGVAWTVGMAAPLPGSLRPFFLERLPPLGRSRAASAGMRCSSRSQAATL